MKTHLLQSVVSQDHQRVMHGELQHMTKTRETVLVYVQRFRQLADMVYPAPNNTQMENLVRRMCLGLKDKELVRRLMRQGCPATPPALIERIDRDCASDDAFQEIYQEQPMEVCVIGYPSDDIAQLRQEIAALKLGGQAPRLMPDKESCLEQRVKDLAGENAALRRAVDDRGRRGHPPFTGNRPPRNRTHSRLICFKCGNKGHIKWAYHGTAAAADPQSQGNALTGGRM